MNNDTSDEAWVRMREEWWTERADAPGSNGAVREGGEGRKDDGCWDKKGTRKDLEAG